uniref:Uncharacterized protein n=1 Tax=Streptomyces sp. NBC_00049 TaxID=2903617 RepID=A0AAU2JQK8_9ACTN
MVASLTGTMERHAAHRAELMLEPFVPGRWEVTGTGRTYADQWSAMAGWKERGPFLRTAGFRLFVWLRPGEQGRDMAVHVVSPAEIAELSTGGSAGSVEPNDESAWTRAASRIFNDFRQ